MPAIEKAKVDLHSPKPKPRVASVYERMPPHSPEAEQAVLGCCLLDPSGCMPKMFERTTDEDMYDLRHRTILKALTEMSASGSKIDTTTLYQWLKDRNEIESVGGVQYIAALPDSAPSSASLDYYLGILLEKAMLRRMISTCVEAVGKAYSDGESDVSGLVEWVEKKIMSVRGKFGRESIPINELVRRAITAIEESFGSNGRITGVPSGIPDLDSLTCGFQPSDMVVLAAFPSTGKTSLAMNMVSYAAVDCQIPSGVFSLEMRGEKLVAWILHSRSRTDSKRIKRGLLDEDDMRRLTVESVRIAKANLHIDSASGLTASQFRAKARRMVQEHGIKFIVVDYLQLLAGDDSKGRDNREREVSGIAKVCKETAMELEIPVMVLSQVNDDGALRESRAIGQHADTVMKLKKSKGAPEDDLDDDVVPTDLKLVKQRDGPTGTVNLVFLKKYTRFEQAAKEEPR